MATTSTKASAESAGAISPETLYTLPEIMRRAGLGRHALRMARRRGLSVRRAHGRAFVLGRDLIEYLVAEGR